jgi:nucleotide-binding universal stress UspA family protein
MSAFKSILLATDFGDASARAEEVACTMATRFGARLTLMHVWVLPTSAYSESITLPIDRIERAAREALDRAAARLRSVVPNLETHLICGDPSRSIVEAAEERGHDLVVLGTHGRHGVPRFFLGSVAEKVVRSAAVPVLTVRGAAPHGS